MNVLPIGFGDLIAFDSFADFAADTALFCVTTADSAKLIKTIRRTIFKSNDIICGGQVSTIERTAKEII